MIPKNGESFIFQGKQHHKTSMACKTFDITSVLCNKHKKLIISLWIKEEELQDICEAHLPILPSTAKICASPAWCPDVLAVLGLGALDTILVRSSLHALQMNEANPQSVLMRELLSTISPEPIYLCIIAIIPYIDWLISSVK